MTHPINNIIEALGEVYSGAGSMEASALIDKLSDRGLTIVPESMVVAYERQHEPRSFVSLPLNNGTWIYVRRSDVVTVYERVVSDGCIIRVISGDEYIIRQSVGQVLELLEGS